MWQKARILVCGRFPQVVGKELWVVVGKPVMKATRDLITHEKLPIESLLDVSIVDENGRLTCAEPRQIELLGGPDAFAEDVPLISWDEFIRGES